MVGLIAAATSLALGAGEGQAQRLLVPMDRTQPNHLRAYGLAYWTLGEGLGGEWLLNYRGGSFLLPDLPQVRREAGVRGVGTEAVDPGREAEIRATMAGANMEAVPLEKAPRVAVYTPPGSAPWDDAVTMALAYAGIPYETLWDPEVLAGDLSRFEWLHLHHEDFTGQYSKFNVTYAGAPWLQEQVALNRAVARRHGFASVPALKKAVAARIRSYVEDGGFLFAMCAGTETLDLALAAAEVDIASAYADDTPADPDATARMDWSRALAFQGAVIQTAPNVNAFSDIDSHQVNTPWRKELGVFTLFEFSAKLDPVPTMLTQSHEAVLPDFYGLTTAFREDRLKPGVLVLAREGDTAKYIHGAAGRGTWTFLGGHDPEDREHQIGDAPTDLALHPNSPGYRLILNNVLFPAAEKKKLKT